MTAPRFEPTPGGAGPRVEGFAGRGFVVGGATYQGLLMTPERALAWTPPALGDLAVSDIAQLLALDPPPEFVILGTGPAQAFPARAFVVALEDKGIGVEAMDSRAAARTWGLLRGEGRWIAAALLPL